jgi:multimeric flavodoxin WrbA
MFSELEAGDVDVRLMDATDLDLQALKAADGYIIGTPNYFSAPSGYIKVFFDEIFEDRSLLAGRPVFCFISHGGSGDIEELRSYCDWLKLEIVGPAIVVRGSSITSSIDSAIQRNVTKMLELL